MLHSNFTLSGCGHHAAAWRRSDSPVERHNDIASYEDLPRTAERGCPDADLFVDGPSVIDPAGGSWWFLESLTALGPMARATVHVGVVTTVSKTFFTPFHAASMLASLDHISGGVRAGTWSPSYSPPRPATTDTRRSPHTRSNTPARTSSSTPLSRCGTRGSTTPSCGTAAGCGPTPTRPAQSIITVNTSSSTARLPSHALRGVGRCCSRPGPPIRGATWRPAAPRASTRWSTTPSPPSRTPGIFARGWGAGRDGDAIVFMQGLITYVGSTQAEALQRKVELDALLPVEQLLTQLSLLTEQDCSDWDLDAQVPTLAPLTEFTGPQGRYETFLRIIEKGSPTVGELLGTLAAGGGHCTTIGTPQIDRRRDRALVPDRRRRRREPHAAHVSPRVTRRSPCY